MKILFVISAAYHPQSLGGTEANTNELCLALQSRGHDVAVLAGLNRRTWFGVRNRLRCFVHFSHCCPPDLICGYPVFRSRRGSADFRRSLDEVTRYYRPDVVITQLADALSLAQQSYAGGVPAAVYCHDVYVDFAQRLGTHPSGISFLSNSEFTAQKLLETLGVGSTVIHNLFHSERYRVTHLGEHVTLVNPHPLKGIDIALSLAKSCPSIPFLFVGSWLCPPSKEYRRRAKAIPNITWVPGTPDMRDIYSKTRIIIVPSRFDETWGRVVTEAQFSGIPALASNRGALPESVGTGGILLPDDAAEQWRASLLSLWNRPERWQELSKSALESAARRELQPAAVVGRFLAFAESLRDRDRQWNSFRPKSHQTGSSGGGAEALDPTEKASS